jgi:N-acetylglutamate synthase
MTITELTIDRYDEVLALMKRTPGVAVREADSRDATARYLERNPGFSFIAEDETRIIGCAMCGHDGRRGYLQHVIVEEACRGRGIAQALVTRCLDRLEAAGILKTHLDVFVTNDLANGYWQRRGWKRRDDIHRYSFIRSMNPNA